ncbi:MAG: hypothetical protein ACREVE_13790 [Gammaproteobacteria bacterium]
MPKKKKPLPDGRALAPTITDFPVDGGLVLSREDIDNLVQHHKLQRDRFPADDNLDNCLDDALQWYFAGKRPRLGYAEQKSYLQEVIDRAAQLREALDRMGNDTAGAIHQKWLRRSTRRGWHARMQADTRCLEQSARIAMAKMLSYSGVDFAFYLLLDRLIDIYECATGTVVTGITKDPVGDEPYTQPLVKFVEDCLSRAGIKKTNSAVGQSLRLAVKRR